MTAVDSLDDVAVRPDVPERWRLGRYFVPKSRYVDPEFLQLEIERVFPRTWMPACRLEEIPGVGDFVEFIIAGESIVVVRAEAGTVRAFFNSCRHRGTRLARGRGRVGNLRCPFHAWQYGLDGVNQYVHDEGDFPDLTPEYLCLRQCKVGEWAGWVFVNLDGNAEPLEEYLYPLPERLALFNIEDMRYTWHKTVTLPCNWKTALEAFSESYHVPGTHPQLIRPLEHSVRPASRRELLDDPSWAPSQALGRHVARYLIEARDPANPRYADKKSLVAISEYHVKELRALHTKKEASAAEELSRSLLPEGPVLFAELKKIVREKALAEGLDWPEFDPAVLGQATGNYTIFPNMIFLVRQGSLLGYRSCPHPTDPDSCVFDAYALELFAPGKAPEFKPETYTEWREGDVGQILTQDFMNVEDVTVGLHSSAFKGTTLNPIQEKPIFHRQLVLDEYIFGPAPGES
jgi:phenylpropionate dioxygenase-like ring-hydroxylating dioxygenase large terminal subunit